MTWQIIFNPRECTTETSSRLGAGHLPGVPRRNPPACFQTHTSAYMSFHISSSTCQTLPEVCQACLRLSSPGPCLRLSRPGHSRPGHCPPSPSRPGPCLCFSRPGHSRPGYCPPSPSRPGPCWSYPPGPGPCQLGPSRPSPCPCHSRSGPCPPAWLTCSPPRPYVASISLQDLLL